VRGIPLLHFLGEQKTGEPSLRLPKPRVAKSLVNGAAKPLRTNARWSYRKYMIGAGKALAIWSMREYEPREGALSMISTPRDSMDSRPKLQSLTLSPNRPNSCTASTAVAVQSSVAIVLTHK
jgi:hypothetical protein